MHQRAVMAIVASAGLLISAVAPATAFAADSQITAVVVSLERDARGDIVSVEHVVPTYQVAATVADLDRLPQVISAGVPTMFHAYDDGAPDPLQSTQWGYRRFGGDQLASVSTGRGVIVAVIDSGVDGTHPDLTGQLVPGADMVNKNGDGTTDLHFHGTHVAGVIAAKSHNGIGISGLAPDAKIMPIRALSRFGGGFSDWIAKGIIWAVDHGATILNLSLGSTMQDKLISDAIAYAVSKDVLPVAAAGNAGFQCGPQGCPISYPAALPGVLAVAATSDDDSRAEFSTTGSYVSLAAPGVNIQSTITTLLNKILPGEDPEYAAVSGTSQAAPQVAGIAAIVSAATGLRGQALMQALVTSAVDIGAPGRDPETGYGLPDAFAAVGQAHHVFANVGRSLDLTTAATGPVTDGSYVTFEAGLTDSFSDGSRAPAALGSAWQGTIQSRSSASEPWATESGVWIGFNQTSGQFDGSPTLRLDLRTHGSREYRLTSQDGKQAGTPLTLEVQPRPTPPAVIRVTPLASSALRVKLTTLVKLRATAQEFGPTGWHPATSVTYCRVQTIPGTARLRPTDRWRSSTTPCVIRGGAITVVMRPKQTALWRVVIPRAVSSPVAVTVVR